MAKSMKARKGNPFEYDTAYSLKEGGYSVVRIDDNTDGVDIIACPNNGMGRTEYIIECKNRQSLSWNELEKIYRKTEKHVTGNDKWSTHAVVFKSFRQPTLVFTGKAVKTFSDFFGCDWNKRPKGYKIWK